MLGKNSPSKKKPGLSPMSSGNLHSVIYALKGETGKNLHRLIRIRIEKRTRSLSRNTRAGMKKILSVDLYQLTLLSFK